MIICLEGWDGHFDVDFHFRPGSPASYGPDGGDPGDPDELEIELVVWEFSEHNYLVLEPKHIGAELHEQLLDQGYAKSRPEDWYSDDSYLHE